MTLESNQFDDDNKKIIEGVKNFAEKWECFTMGLSLILRSSWYPPPDIQLSDHWSGSHD